MSDLYIDKQRTILWRPFSSVPCDNLMAAKVQHDRIILFHVIQTNNLLRNCLIYSKTFLSYTCRMRQSCKCFRSLARVRDSAFGQFTFMPGGGTQQSLIQGGSAPRSNPLPFYIPFWQKRYPFYIPFIEKRYPSVHIPTLEHCTPFLSPSCCHFHVMINK